MNETEKKTPTNKKAAVAVLIVALLSIAFIITQVLQPFYTLQTEKNTGVGVTVEIHCRVQQFRHGILISESYHTMTLVDAGKDWIADKLFNSAGTNVTQYAMYIGCSNDSSSVSTSWTYLPSEIASNGLTRALAAWSDTGTGTGTLTKSFSVTGDSATKLYGLYSQTAALAPQSTLVAAEQQGSGNQKNMVNGDTLAVTITITIS